LALPRPLKKPPKRTAQDVTVRRIGSAEPVEVVAPDELARRKEEAEWERQRRSQGIDLRDEHARYALKLGEPFLTPSYTGDLWWFVRDVNGPDRTITGATLIFEQPIERTFPFEMVETFRIWHIEDQNDAAIYVAKIASRLGPVRKRRRKKPRAA
jgi:hypothetical protein